MCSGPLYKNTVTLNNTCLTWLHLHTTQWHSTIHDSNSHVHIMTTSCTWHNGTQLYSLLYTHIYVQPDSTVHGHSSPTLTYYQLFFHDLFILYFLSFLFHYWVLLFFSPFITFPLFVFFPLFFIFLQLFFYFLSCLFHFCLLIPPLTLSISCMSGK